MRRIAIGCQGGGSHTAFTAGALSAIIQDQIQHGDFEIGALSGTSGGAISATLAWYGLLLDGGPAAIQRLDRFWREGFPSGGAARMIPDRIANAAFVNALRMPVSTGVSPYATQRLLNLLPAAAQAQLRPWLDAQDGLRSILREYVDFDRIPALVERDQGRHELLVGAVDVLNGTFVAFRGSDPNFSIDCVVASGTLPEIARATVIAEGGYAGVYWDGLYSQNPPISEFFRLGAKGIEDKPDEIWVIRINPVERPEEPQSLHDIVDRRNELAGNQSLQQELDSTRFINELARAYRAAVRTLTNVADGEASRLLQTSALAGLLQSLKPVDLPPAIEMSSDVSRQLDYASKFSRSPAFLEMLINHGAEQARAFLHRWRKASS
jgi:NTE family protein